MTGTIVASALRGLLPEHELSFLVGLSLQMDQRSNRISPDELGSLRSLLQMRCVCQYIACVVFHMKYPANLQILAAI